MRRGYTGPGTNKPTASVSKIRPGRAGAAPAGGPRGRSLRRSRTPPRTPQAAALPARADHAAPITHRRLSTTRRRGGEVARRGEQRPGVDEKGTASVPSCRDLVSPCPHVLMSSCPPVLLSSCPPVLLPSCPRVPVSSCPRRVLLHRWWERSRCGWPPSRVSGVACGGWCARRTLDLVSHCLCLRCRSEYVRRRII